MVKSSVCNEVAASVSVVSGDSLRARLALNPFCRKSSTEFPSPAGLTPKPRCSLLMTDKVMVWMAPSSAKDATSSLSMNGLAETKLLFNAEFPEIPLSSSLRLAACARASGSGMAQVNKSDMSAGIELELLAVNWVGDAAASLLLASLHAVSGVRWLKVTLWPTPKKRLSTARDHLSAHARRPLQAAAWLIRSTRGRTRQIGALMPCDDGNAELRIERVDKGTSNTRVF